MPRTILLCLFYVLWPLQWYTPDRCCCEIFYYGLDTETLSIVVDLNEFKFFRFQANSLGNLCRDLEKSLSVLLQFLFLDIRYDLKLQTTQSIMIARHCTTIRYKYQHSVLNSYSSSFI